MAAYRLESGYNNITAQIKRKGLEAIVVDKHGNAYKEDEWISSNVFWKGEQENLLVSDNQTMKYALANEETKRYFSLLAWGIK